MAGYGSGGYGSGGYGSSVVLVPVIPATPRTKGHRVITGLTSHRYAQAADQHTVRISPELHRFVQPINQSVVRIKPKQLII